MKTIRKVLVANRGEIAVRVIETLHRMGIESVAVYSDADATAPHVRAAGEAVRLGPAAATQSYLDIEKVIAAARATGADAVHPGYGFLSENQSFASALAESGIVFIGPPSSAIATMGDKITARDAVTARGVPVVPGLSRPGLTDEDLIAAAPDIGFPVLIKPSAGGGGKGMHRVTDPAELPAALVTARREAGAAFGDDSLFLEHFVLTPRHIEVQVLADEHGNVVHLGERECSLQRRHQKVIEEAPSALLDEATRSRIGQAACDAARSVGYTGAGTVEFIVSARSPEDFFFMEMNTRLQVEHPVTEMVTGYDLVEQQVRIARGEQLAFSQDDVTLTGHSIEARVYAEDPAQGFLPTGGRITDLKWVARPIRSAAPASGLARIDSGVEAGSVVGSDYDPMLAKVIVHGADRAEAIDKLDEALAQTRLTGVVTNIDFCRFVLGQDAVRAGELDTELLDRLVVDYAAPAPSPQALVAASLGGLDLGTADDLWSSAHGFRIGTPSPFVSRLAVDARHYTVSSVLRPSADASSLAADVTVESVAGEASDGQAKGGEAKGGEESETQTWQAPVRMTPLPDGSIALACDGVRQRWVVRTDRAAGIRWVAGDAGTWLVHAIRALADAEDEDAVGDVTSPMPGTVVAVPGNSGDTVAAGEPLVVVEAMKMEHTLKAPIDGVARIDVKPGDKVSSAQLLAHVAPPES
ncbi:acetyl/propionyl/methylcrotonyl-CoA carboxylase subunit alpha [Gordonia zhaorongruii]|uniref:acetyl/propionyl/methylcrotonyl-CoA carboxylase subunit alpha n=1 Tax=Gordonia zhaorongruii TaxID=2597659 RepID=UPI0010504D9C|nr:biotin carboxylase N-terminal domain-containing protein [Gordonia zhaorongruii]